jgi:hypothetical protein
VGVIVRGLAIWLVLLVLAVMNGAFREAVFAPRLGPASAHVASTVTLTLLIAVVAALSIEWISVPTTGDALLVGLMWTGLTVAFEFVGGHYLFGRPWDVLLADYNLARGRIFAVVLVATFLAPIWAQRLAR